MRINLTLLLISFIVQTSFGQDLTLTDVHNIANKKSWEDVNQFLMDKGWEYYASEKGRSTKHNTITWSFNRSYGDKAQAWFYLYMYEGMPNKVHYSVFNKSSYTIIQKSLTSKGYKLSKSEIEENQLISTYSNSKFILSITTEKRETEREESITGYNFSLIKKSGIYDPDNGKKTDYSYGDVKEAEYTLKNGKLHGLLRVFYYNGKLKRTGNYINGKANGTFIEYDEEGNITTKYIMKNGLKNGSLEFFENNKILSSTTYLNDIKNGNYVEYQYNDNGEVLVKLYGQYLKDKKDGAWKIFVLEDGKERLLDYTNYNEGIKNGQFQESKGDSLIIGTYRNDKLNGDYKLYHDLTTKLLGGVIKTDTNKLTLILDGKYFNNKKIGYWKEYDFTSALREEGGYDDGERTGEWKYYYSKFIDDKSVGAPYSEKLYLINNFSNGKLNGKSTRFSYLNEVKVPCSEYNGYKNSLDTCIRFVYEKVLETVHYKDNKLNGPFELKDSTNQVIASGMFVNGLKNGKWFSRFTQNDSQEKEHFIYQEGYYSNNKREGEWIEYYKKGFVSKTFNYKHGVLNGKYTEWNSFNQPAVEKRFIAGSLKEVAIYDSIENKLVLKFEIFGEKEKSYRCRRSMYSLGGHSFQEYWLYKENEIDHELFISNFIMAVDNNLSDPSKGYKDGACGVFDSIGQPLELGRYLRGYKDGTWIKYYYDQQVKIQYTYNADIQLDEKYFNLNGEKFSGEFFLIDKEESVKEIRKVKKGLRHGKTRFIDLRTGKTLKKEYYKKGIKK